MNKYLEKIASKLDSVKRYAGYVTGATSRDAGEKLRHVKDFVSKKENVRTLERRKAFVDKQTTKARVGTAIAGAGLAAAGAYGYKKKRDNQRQETMRQFGDFYKSSSAGAAARELGKSTVSGVGKILKRVGAMAGDVMTTSSGGHIKDYANRHGIHYKSKEYKAFSKGKTDERAKIVSDHQIKTNKNISKNDHAKIHDEHRANIKDLERGQLHARITLGATGVAGVSAYGTHKARQALKEKENYYR